MENDYNKLWNAYRQGACYQMSFEYFLETRAPQNEKEQKEIENAYNYFLDLQPTANVLCKY